MPDILIRGLEYPKSCSRCDFASVVPGEVWCKRAKEIVPEEQTISGNRPTFCPLHELPPHGDLIDRDQLAKTLDYYIREAGWGDEINKALGWVRDDFIKGEAVIVPASEEDVK